MERAGTIPPECLRALESAQRRYRGFPNVFGIALGFKYRGGLLAGGPSVQFFVRRKVKGPSRILPRFVFGRGPRGEVLRSLRIPTDVIEMERPRFACCAGGKVRSFARRGSAAMIFRDKGPGGAAGETGGSYYLITCAHVVGRLDRSPPLSPGLRIDERPELDPFTVVLKNAVARGGGLDYDVALARVEDAALPVEDLGIVGGGRISGWLEPEDLALGDPLEVFASGRRRRGEVESLAGEFAVEIDGEIFRVRNLYALGVEVRDGDSGGLVCSGGLAAGIVVARSPGGYAWWQPLRQALEHLNRLKPRTNVWPFAPGGGDGEDRSRRLHRRKRP